MLDNPNQLNQEYKVEQENASKGGDLVVKTERDELGRFVEGHPKMGGMKKGFVSPRRALREKLQEIREVNIGDRKEQKTGLEILSEVLFKKAVGGDLGAIREFFDRVEGRAKILGVNEEPDEINLTAVFQQIFQEGENKRRREEEENNNQ